MARIPRIDLPGIPQHIVQRGNDRQACFADDADYLRYRQELGEAALKHDCAVHAYVLMTNHVHLLLTPAERGATSRMMQAIGRRYVGAFNARYRRTGTLWEGRFKAALVDSTRYLLTCHRYIELNPVRAEMVSHPGEYRWSSYRANAQGEANMLLSPHPLYLALGADAIARQAAYRELFRFELEPALVDSIRQATNGNFVLGDGRFGDQVARALGRRVMPGKSGRPRKLPEPESGELPLGEKVL